MKLTLSDIRLILLAIDTHLSEMACATEPYIYSDGRVAKLSTNDKQNLAEIKALEKLKLKLAGDHNGAANGTK